MTVKQMFGSVLNLSSLNGTNGFTINGVSTFDSSGSAISGIGDINGDDLVDFAIGAFGADPKGYSSGSTYIVYGRSGGFGSSLNLSSLNGTNGFTINGAAAFDYSGKAISGIGDINGDDLVDFAIAAPLADPNGSASGSTYIIYGSSERFRSSLSLSSLNGTNGFTINGVAAYDFSGSAISGIGDINGDDLVDLAIGAPKTDSNGFYAGTTYIVYGKSGGFGSSLNLSSLNGTNGFTINGVAAVDYSGSAISGIGDINGDDLVDFAIGAPGANPNGYYSGSTYIVYGKSGGFGSSLNLSSLNGTNGFTINGAAAGEFSGKAISGIGDINGDGLVDFAIAAPSADSNGSSSGSTYIIYGRSGGFGSSLNLSSLNGTNGFTISGVSAIDYSGSAISGLGDINGDDLADFAIGAPGADPNGSGSGSTYIIYGRSGGFGSSLNLSSLNGTNGFTINGVAARDLSGSAISGIGDINKDGGLDFAIGAPLADPYGSASGSTYVIYGIPSTTSTPRITINDVSLIEGNTNSSRAVFTVNLNNSSATPVTVSYTTRNGTARAGSDYTTKTGTIRFNVGETSKTISIPIINNNISEPDETFNLVLSNPQNATILDGRGIATISDTLKSSVTATLPTGVENLTLTGTRNINGRGNLRNNIITGNRGINTLNGANGNDTLIGGAGNDTLTGGAGNDRFTFSTGVRFTATSLGVDRITDFTPDFDKIVLSKTTFATISSVPRVGFSVASEFVTVTTDSAAATRAADIVYNTTNGKLFYNQNGITAGLGTGAQFATITGNPVISGNDFVIIA